MTITLTQAKAMFGRPAAWEVAFVTRPQGGQSDFMRELNNAPNWIKGHLGEAIGKINRERKAGSEQPTQCLLCETDFMQRSPAIIGIMHPTTHEGSSALFFFCDQCARLEDLQDRTMARLYKGIGARSTQWGHA